MPSTVRLGVLYRLDKNFLTLNFFFIDQTFFTVIFIQTTISRRHTDTGSDVKSLMEYLDENPSNIMYPPVSFVLLCVGPDRTDAKALATAYPNGILSLCNTDEDMLHIRAGYSVVSFPAWDAVSLQVSFVTLGC